MAKLLYAFQIFLGCITISNTLIAQEVKEKAPIETVHNVISVSEHTARIEGADVTYKATAGTLQQKNEKGESKASLFYIAYNRTNGKNSVKRPVAFCFNGGPGSASAWLHMGLLGPKRVLLEKGRLTTPPYGYIDNEYSLLDLVDLVFIDPVSTGYSRAAANEDPTQFHGVEADINSVGEFIRLYTTQNGRWESPKFLIGESYGTTRAALLVDNLQDHNYMYFNGVILISSVLDFQTIDKMERSNDLTFVLYLPSYTAAAWYHKKLPEDLQKMSLREVLQESKNFAVGEYSVALLKGDKLAPDVHTSISSKLARFTGLSQDYVDKMNLRVSAYTFLKELLTKQNLVIGRFDSRTTGIDLDSISSTMNYDPALDAALAAFTAAFNEYVRTELDWKSNEEYRILTDVSPWDYGKASNHYLNTATSLRTAMTRNPLLEVFVASGYFDLAAPYFATDYTFDHLGLGPLLSPHVTMGYYEAGHMMFTDMLVLPKLSRDLHTFVNRLTSRTSTSE